MLHKAMQNEGSRVAIAVLATFLYAVGVNLFIVPVGLYSGGVVGLSQVLRTVLAQRAALPAGVGIAGSLYFLLNVPMLFLGWRELGRGFLVRTLICVGASSLFLSIIPAPASPILDERLAACVVGGWDPIRTSLVCLAFGAADAAQIRIQTLSNFPYQFLQMFPYVVTVIALAIMVKRSRVPKTWGAAYDPKDV